MRHLRNLLFPVVLYACNIGPVTKPTPPSCQGLTTGTIPCGATRGGSNCYVIDTTLAGRCTDLCAGGCATAPPSFSFRARYRIPLRHVSSDPPDSPYPMIEVGFGNQNDSNEIDVWMVDFVCDSRGAVRGVVRSDNSRPDFFTIYGAHGSSIGASLVNIAGRVVQRDSAGAPSEISVIVRRLLTYQTGVISQVFEGVWRSADALACP